MVPVDMCSLQIWVIIYFMMIHMTTPLPLIHADIYDIMHLCQGEHFRILTH